MRSLGDYCPSWHITARRSNVWLLSYNVFAYFHVCITSDYYYWQCLYFSAIADWFKGRSIEVCAYIISGHTFERCAVNSICPVKEVITDMQLGFFFLFFLRLLKTVPSLRKESRFSRRFYTLTLRVRTRQSRTLARVPGYFVTEGPCILNPALDVQIRCSEYTN